MILVAWTIFIKYLFPIGFALVSNEGWATYIYWDLWPVAHLWLAIGVSVVEILIITTLFIWFLQEPEWSIWRTNWFVNKVFVLAAFVLVLSTALFRPETLKAQLSDGFKGHNMVDK